MKSSHLGTEQATPAAWGDQPRTPNRCTQASRAPLMLPRVQAARRADRSPIHLVADRRTLGRHPSPAGLITYIQTSNYLESRIVQPVGAMRQRG